MGEHDLQELEALIGGRLSADEAARVRLHLAECAVCGAALEGLTLLPAEDSGAAQEVPLPLFAEGGWRRLLHLAPQLARLFDLDEEQIEAILSTVDDEAGWEEGPAEGVSLRPVVGGPRVSDALCSLVRVRAGDTFPDHEHLGDESVFVLQGGFTDSADGRTYWRGELSVNKPGTAHAFTTFTDVDCLCAVVLRLG